MVASQLIFLGVFLLVIGGIHAFLYRRLVRGLSIESRPVRWTLRALAVLLALSYPLTRWLDTFAPEGVLFAAHWIAGMWLGLMFQLFWMGLDVWLVSRVLRLHRRLRWSGPIGVSLVALAAGVVCTLGLVGAQRDAKVVRYEVPVSGVTSSIAALKIAVFADLHAGALVDDAFVRRRVAEVNALEPDLVLIPGDILDQPADRLDWLVDALSGLRATHGVYATTGNHEYYVDADASVALLERAGIQVLRDEHVDVPIGLVIAGTEDPTAERFGRPRHAAEAILQGAVPSKPVLFLAHTPARADVDAAIAAGADLVLSGHTHGGQIWPFSYLTRLAFEYHHGLYAVGTGHQLTTCGIGFWGPPMRLGAPPEIVLVSLVPAGRTTRP